MADTLKNAIAVVGIDIRIPPGLCEGDVDKQNQPTRVLATMPINISDFRK